jgi:hypothetical protein
LQTLTGQFPWLIYFSALSFLQKRECLRETQKKGKKISEKRN